MKLSTRTQMVRKRVKEETMPIDEVVSRLNRLSIDYSRRAALEENLYDELCSTDHRALAEEYRKNAIALNLAARII